MLNNERLHFTSFHSDRTLNVGFSSFREESLPVCLIVDDFV